MYFTDAWCHFNTYAQITAFPPSILKPDFNGRVCLPVFKPAAFLQQFNINIIIIFTRTALAEGFNTYSNETNRARAEDRGPRQKKMKIKAKEKLERKREGREESRD